MLNLENVGPFFTALVFQTREMEECGEITQEPPSYTQNAAEQHSIPLPKQTRRSCLPPGEITGGGQFNPGAASTGHVEMTSVGLNGAQAGAGLIK